MPLIGRIYFGLTPSSLNRNLEDSLYLKKAHSLGHLRQEADLLGFAQPRKSITLASIVPGSGSRRPGLPNDVS